MQRKNRTSPIVCLLAAATAAVVLGPSGFSLSVAKAQQATPRPKCSAEASDLAALLDCERQATGGNGINCDASEPLRLRRPAAGRRMIAFGDATATGSRSKGLVIEATGEPDVTAPARGTVIFAGDFRSYGKLLILNVCGHHVLLAGSSSLLVSEGAVVEAGVRVARLAAPSSAGAPVLYVELRRNGIAIDPAPHFVD